MAFAAQYTRPMLRANRSIAKPNARTTAIDRMMISAMHEIYG